MQAKALILLNAGRGRRERLLGECDAVARNVLKRLAPGNARATVMARIGWDPLGLASKAPVYDVTVELRADTECAALAAALDGIAAGLPSLHADRTASAIVVGTQRWFIPCAPRAVRFQYLMRRRRDLTHDAYLKHYAEIHSAFGFKTRGVQGYDQLHVDPELSADAAARSGLGTCDFDGVSQLHMGSLAPFILAVPLNATMGALEDEKNFVDLDRSAMFSSRIVSEFAGIWQ